MKKGKSLITTSNSTDNIWTNDSDKFVLYLDIMGFKDTIKSSRHLKLKAKLE